MNKKNTIYKNLGEAMQSFGHYVPELMKLLEDVSKERDEARKLAEKKNDALLSVCKQYCDWYDNGINADAGNAFYDAKCTAGAAWEPVPWEEKK